MNTSFLLKIKIRTTMKKKNWKTTIGGILSAIGFGLKASATNPVLLWVGDGLVIVGTLIVGSTAADAV